MPLLTIPRSDKKVNISTNGMDTIHLYGRYGFFQFLAYTCNVNDNPIESEQKQSRQAVSIVKGIPQDGVGHYPLKT